MGVYRRFLVSSILAISSLIIISPISLSETIERSLTLKSSSNQSFETLLQQAEDLATVAIEQEFIENTQTTKISVTVLGENNGQIVPLLRSKVSRNQWQRDSRISRWTKYFTINSGVLLGFYNHSASRPTVPQAHQVVPARNRQANQPGFRDD